MTDPVKELLERALNAIDQRGWAPDHIENKAGQVCVRGALCVAFGNMSLDQRITGSDRVLSQYLGDEHGARTAVHQALTRLTRQLPSEFLAKFDSTAPLSKKVVRWNDHWLADAAEARDWLKRAIDDTEEA